MHCQGGKFDPTTYIPHIGQRKSSDDSDKRGAISPACLLYHIRPKNARNLKGRWILWQRQKSSLRATTGVWRVR